MAEQEKIQKYIIKSTPFGELSDVLSNLNTISNLDLQSPSISSTIEEYNQEHLAIIPLPPSQGTKKSFVLMAKNRVGENQYIDQSNEKVYTVDHIKLEIIHANNTAVDLPPEVKELVRHISAEVQGYVDRYFRIPNGFQGECCVTQYLRRSAGRS
jgi:hypothetical protein